MTSHESDTVLNSTQTVSTQYSDGTNASSQHFDSEMPQNPFYVPETPEPIIPLVPSPILSHPLESYIEQASQHQSQQRQTPEPAPSSVPFLPILVGHRDFFVTKFIIEGSERTITGLNALLVTSALYYDGLIRVSKIIPQRYLRNCYQFLIVDLLEEHHDQSKQIHAFLTNNGAVFEKYTFQPSQKITANYVIEFLMQ